MPGAVWVIGLGPGDPLWITPQAAQALEHASDLIGYGPYLERVPVRENQTRHASDNRVEIDRARHALRLASEGRHVAVVSSGDPGVYAMAAAVFEAIETGDPAWRRLLVEVVPGITAMQAAAARFGAPLGHDFCAISLSDNLKPWSIIKRRIRAAARADFVIAFYNPVSRSRPAGLQAAFSYLRAIRSPETPVMFARAVGSEQETVSLATLETARGEHADMRTLVLIGSSMTRQIERSDGGVWVYTPRSYLKER